MGQLTTHVLNTSTGKPAQGIHVTLEYFENDRWQKITENITNDDGRITNFTDNLELKNGNYQITFQVSEYFSKANTKAFYPYVSIVFIIDSADHYHVPLLLNPYGYSTYRGS